MIGIYKIENKINHKCYIGQSINIPLRWQIHCQPCIYNNPKRKEYNYALYTAFRKYGLDNFDFTIIEECKVEELNDKEKYWINYYDSYHQGYNMTIGGDGIVKESEIPVYIYNIDGSYAGEFINVQTAATILNCNQKSIYCAISEGSLYKNYQWRYFKTNQIDYHISNKIPVIAFNLDGNKIKIYDSLIDAVKDSQDSEISITSQCKTKIYNNTKYQWRYYFENPILDYIGSSIDNSNYIIDQYDLQGNFITTYNSLLEAANTLGLNSANLTTTLQGKQKSYGGYLWCYHGDTAPQPYIDNRFNHTTSSSKRIVEQYSKQNELLHEYESAHEAARSINKPTCANHITECCQGKRKTCQGYIWRYK